MKSILSATVCAAVLASAIPAMAASDDAAMPPMHHHHHMMHGKHGMMKNGAMSGDAETAKLNEQSLQNAKAGVMPASGASSGNGMTPATDGAMAAPGTGMAAPGTGMAAPNSGAMAAPGTGMAAPSSGAMAAPAMSAPGSMPGAMSAPGTGVSTPTSGAMGSGMSTNAPPMTSPPVAADPNNK